MTRSLKIITAGLWLYCLASYLVLLRDPFLLERIALALGNSQWQFWWLNLAAALKINYSSYLVLLISFAAILFGYIGLIKSGFKSVSKTKLLLLWLPVLISFPALSTDVFDYNNYNRVVLNHQANPWVVPADSFTGDDYIYMGSWLDRPTVYPFLWIGISVSLASIVGTHPLVAAWMFKFLAMISVWLIGLGLKQLKPKQNWDFWFYLHPLVLIEFIGNGHNDAPMVALLVLSLVLWKRKSLSQAWLALVAAVLVKISACFYFPGLVWDFWKQNQRTLLWRLSSLSLFALILLFIGFESTISAFYSTLIDQSSTYYHSFPGFIWQLSGSSQLLVRLTQLIVAGLIIWSQRQPLLKSGLHLNLTLLAAYLWGVSSMVQPWYVSWLLPLVVWLGSSTKLGRVVQIYALFIMPFTYGLRYFSLWFSPDSVWWQGIIGGLPVMLVLLLLYQSQWYTRFKGLIYAPGTK